MQSIFRLPWCSEHIAPKLPDEAPLDKVRPAPVVEIPVWNKLKRKRTNSAGDGASSRAQPKKKERPAGLATAAVVPSGKSRATSRNGDEQTSMQASAGAYSTSQTGHVDSSRGGDGALLTPTSLNSAKVLCDDKMLDSDDASLLDLQDPTSNDGLTRLQEVIENEFNMQILMKHSELRLIEQELAKCQTALEQLRRVELRPYPGSDRPSESVSTGTGSSILPPPGYTRPEYAAPYGVTDGPYTRHYNQWLLHDPSFESMPAQAAFFADATPNAAGRSTRNSGSTRKSISKPFSFPSRPADSLQSIPNYPSPMVKDKSAPLILKRSTDNQFVKLICNNCLRGNFSSIQGFLNHCRIAHKVDYKSHDAAAIDCGRLLDENEAASLPPETLNTPAHKPSLSRISTATTTPFQNLVHPLNTTAAPALSRSNGQQPSAVARIPVPSLAFAAQSPNDSPLNASSQTPRLSAHFAKHQLGGDLAAAVAGARQRIDLDYDDETSSPDISEQSSPLEPMMHARTVSGNGRASMMTMPGARPSSRKGIRQNGRQPRPSPLAPVSSTGADRRELSEIPESPHYHSMNLSPHTADSNPGLVSDHDEDDDHGSASEEEAPQTEIPRPPFPGVVGGGTTCSDNVEVDVGDGDEDRIIIRRNSVFGDEERELGAAGATPTRKLGLGKRGA